MKFDKAPVDITTGTNRVLSSATPNYVVPTNPYNEKEIMGFLPYWQLPNYATLEYDKLSTIAYFSMPCYDNGQWVTSDTGYQAFFSSNFAKMRALAKQHKVKVVPVVKNFDARSIYRLMTNVNGAGDTLIENIVDLVKDYDLDGVNIDFEYIASTSWPVNSALRNGFVAWHDKLAKRLHTEVPGSIVSTDTFGSSPIGYTAYDLPALGRTAIDYIDIMSYDYIVTSCYNGKKIGPESPLYGNNLYGTPNWNVSYHITQATLQVPAAKILMGVPYYGIDFKVLTAERNNYNARLDYANGCGGAIETFGSIVNADQDQWHNANTIKWNNTEKATYYIYNYNGTWRHGYYDDYRSLAAKYDFVRNSKLGGIGIWALGYDKGTSELYNVIRDKFQESPYIVGFSTSVSEGRINAIFDEVNVDVVEDLGNNMFRVVPTNELSTASITKMKRYPEVFSAGFEVNNVNRGVN
jgi:spore germination protein